MGRVMTAGRISAVAIVVLLAAEIALMPWSGHLYDATVFFTLADSVFFAHTPLSGNWSFGGLALFLVLLSQIPVLLVPSLATVNPVRLFLLKLPSWLSDLGTAAIVRWSCSDPAYANSWALRYLADPAVIFATVLHGQWDAVPNMLAVAGIASLLAGKYELAALALGLGAGTKFYPAAFVPLLLAVAYRASSLRTAVRVLGVFAVTAAVTLAPTFLGRLDYIVHAYTFNSFGYGQGVFTFSLWSLLPQRLAISSHVEQFVAVLIPLGLAAAELRHTPKKRDIARAALISAMSIVLLNPGAHPPFYIWIAGPLVLYAAVTNDGLVSLAGIVLSTAGAMTQFCLEGSGEYFVLGTDRIPNAHVIPCIASTNTLGLVIFLSAVFIVLVSYSNPVEERWAKVGRVAGQVAALACAAAFLAEIGSAIISTRNHGRVVTVSRREDNEFYLLALSPKKKAIENGCLLSYDSFGSAAYAGIPFASRFVKASLGYTLFSPEELVIRGQSLPVSSLPLRYESLDLTVYGDRPMRVTQEYDVTSLLAPVAVREQIIERPCDLTRRNPLLIYRFDITAAREAAVRETFPKRLEIFSQETPGPASTTGVP